MHALDDSELKPYKCLYDGCGKRFSKSSNLTQHLRIHSGEKPFQCEVCGRNFRQSGNLTKHLKSHENAHLRWNRSTSDKPYKCPHDGCDKSFTAKSSLQNHVRTHTGETPFICPVENCGESFHIKSVLSNHLKTHRDRTNLRYHCIHPSCKKSFKDESELRAHLIAFNPGMAAENQFLRDSVVALLGGLEKLQGVDSVLCKKVIGSSDLQEIRSGVDSLSSLTYSQGAGSVFAGLCSTQPKSAVKNYMKSEFNYNVPPTSADHLSNKGSMMNALGMHPVSAAWLIHQSEEGAAVHSEEEDEEGAESRTAQQQQQSVDHIPLDVACGYFDDVFDATSPLFMPHLAGPDFKEFGGLGGDHLPMMNAWPFTDHLEPSVHHEFESAAPQPSSNYQFSGQQNAQFHSYPNHQQGEFGLPSTAASENYGHHLNGFGGSHNNCNTFTTVNTPIYHAPSQHDVHQGSSHSYVSSVPPPQQHMSHDAGAPPLQSSGVKRAREES